MSAPASLSAGRGRIGNPPRSLRPWLLAGGVVLGVLAFLAGARPAAALSSADATVVNAINATRGSSLSVNGGLSAAMLVPPPQDRQVSTAPNRLPGARYRRRRPPGSGARSSGSEP